MQRIVLLLALGLSMNAVAVQLNPNGTGEALIYPLYLTGDYDTLITVTNETEQPKAISMRILDYGVGVTTLSWIAYLKPFDTITLTITGDGEELSLVNVPDSSCTVPQFPDAGQPMTNFLFSNDAFEDTTSRTDFGFVEIIEMGEVMGESAALITDNDCDLLVGAWRIDGFWREDPATDMLPPGGGLAGSAWIIDVEFGDAYGMNAVAFEEFSDVQINNRPGDPTPNLLSISPTEDSMYRATVRTENGIFDVDYERPVDAISALLMTTAASMNFSAEQAISGRPVIYSTSPTMRYYVDPFYSDQPEPRAPFDAPMTPQGAANTVLLDISDREGQAPEACDTMNLVERPDGSIGEALQNTAVQASILSNTVNFTTTSPAVRIRPETPAGRVSIGFGPGAEDWFRCADELDLSGRILSGGTVVGGERNGQSITLAGLPVIVSILQRATNGNVLDSNGDLLRANYGVTHNARTRTVATFDN